VNKISTQTRAADETFWRQQEKRRQQLGQPCCSQSNMSWALFDMPGDFAVVIHGESDCLNCFFHHQGGSGAAYYSSRLTDNQITLGDTQRPLGHLLRLIAAERRPEAVIVLGTCPVEVIGDRFEVIVEAVAAETGIPMIPLHTHGLALLPLHRVQDWLYATLASLALPDPPTERRGVSLLGLPPSHSRAELQAVLSALGTELHGTYPDRVPLDDWRRITHAEACYAADSSMYKKLSRVLASAGQPIVDVPMPFGIDATDRFYQAIAAHRNIPDDQLDDALTPHRTQPAASIAAFRARAAGRKIALCIRMLKTHRADLLAYGGLSAHGMLTELGFEVEVLVQGPPEATALAGYQRLLEKQGLGEVPLTPFPGPWKLGEALQAGGFDGAIMSDVARNVVEQAGIPWVSSGALRPLYAGMSDNLSLLERLL
jgi:nitrogenase molybdenum-iron protein alpha/beta subunit